MDVFTVVFGGTLAFFVIFVLLLGVFSKRSARDYLDWKPTRSPEVEAQNARRRATGRPERTEEDVRIQVAEDERWREELRRRVRESNDG